MGSIDPNKDEKYEWGIISVKGQVNLIIKILEM